jgi:hypothetical protein
MIAIATLVIGGSAANGVAVAQPAPSADELTGKLQRALNTSLPAEEQASELETEAIRAGEISIADKREILQGIWRKTKRQTLKDYVIGRRAGHLLFARALIVAFRCWPDRWRRGCSRET